MTRQTGQFPLWPTQTSRQPTQPSRTAINSTAAQPIHNIPAAAVGSAVPVVYGQAAVSPLIYALKLSTVYLYVGCAWCIGEIEEIVEYYDGDEVLPSAYVVGEYLGTATQTADATLAAVIAGYTDTLVGTYFGETIGIAHTVLRLPVTADFPTRLKAVIRGRRVRDPRLTHNPLSVTPSTDRVNKASHGLVAGDAGQFSTTGVLPAGISAATDYYVINPQSTYYQVSATKGGSTIDITDAGSGTLTFTHMHGYYPNPALCLADFAESAALGLGMSVDDTSLGNAADHCDVDVSGSPRRTLNLAIVRRAQVAQHIETLRAYAACLVVQDGPELKLVPNKAGSSVYSIGEDIIKRISISKVGTADIPTVVIVEWTDQQTWPYSTRKVTEATAAVTAGTQDYRESPISMLGIIDASEAERAAIERLKYFTLSDLRVSLSVFDEGLQLEVGDIVDVTHQWGLTAKDMRVVRLDATSPGRWDLDLEEYDAAVYSVATASAPSNPDTSLPTPEDVPAITGLTVAEEVYQTDKGFYLSRIKVDWTSVAATYPYPVRYRIIIDSPTPRRIIEILSNDVSVDSPPVEEGITYTIQVRAEADWGGRSHVGAYASDTLAVAGKTALPGDVATLTGFEAGGVVFLEWTAASGDDVWKYEIRYAATAAGWAGATVLDRTDALRHQIEGIAEGTYDFMLKAIDSVEVESANAVVKNIVVSYDSYNAEGAEFEYEGNTTYSGAEYVISQGDVCFVTFGGTSWDVGLPAAMSTYSALLCSYTANTASSWTSEEKDWGRVIFGTWHMPEFDATLVGGGSPTKTMQLEDPDSSWDDYVSLSERGYFKASQAKADAVSGEVMIVRLPGVTQAVRSKPKIHSGKGYYDGVTPTTVSLDFALNGVSSIQITPIGSRSRHGVPDNVVFGASPTFDVVIYENAGIDADTVASYFYWEIKGV